LVNPVPECSDVRGFTGDNPPPSDLGASKFFEYRYGGSYNLYLQRLPSSGGLVVDVEEVTPPNSLHIAWLLPQYIVLSAGEVLFSITSLAFAFTQVSKQHSDMHAHAASSINVIGQAASFLPHLIIESC
jgi:dipeptide/tripeptide permease